MGEGKLKRIAILARSGGCFPNIVALGLKHQFEKEGAICKVFDGIPSLMRMLPLTQKPRRWKSNLKYRFYNKLKYLKQDRELTRQLKTFDVVVLAECFPNALWKNYLAIEVLRKKTKKQIWSYTDGPVSSAPVHAEMHFRTDELKNEVRFDKNLFLTNIIEVRGQLSPSQKVVGLDLTYTNLKPVEKKEFIAVVDFAKSGYEFFREQQIATLKKLNIETIVLQGRYSIEEIRLIYQKASVFFLAFPETFGLPIAECLSTGTYIFTPSSSWPMAWRLDAEPGSWEPGILPDCFCVYKNVAELETLILDVKKKYHSIDTPKKVQNTYLEHYPNYYKGNQVAIKELLQDI